MKFSKIALAIIAGAAVAIPATSATPTRPTLVLGIVVEGLSTDHLSLLSDMMLDGGFKRLQSDGIWIDNIGYGSDLDAVAATTVAFTGAPPAVNGIGARKVYDRDRRAAFHVFNDPEKVGNFTNETYSPKAIATSTIADELRIDSRGNGIVESVAADPAIAIIMSGHAGNGAFWINDTDGNWASSTYYTDMPNAVSRRNYASPLSARLDTIVWEPLFNPMLLPGLSEQKRIKPFKHTFLKGNPDRYAAFKASARGNTEVTDMALEVMKATSLGRHNAIDMLNVAYTLAPYSYGRSADSALETLDAYLRLDRDIARLIAAARANARDGALAVFLVGIPAPQHDKRDSEYFRIPYGQFSVKRAESLLNMYLMAIYGNGNWITGYYNYYFYLNHQLIKDKNLDLDDLRRKSAEFLTKMSGVAQAFTIDDIIASRAGDNALALKRNTIVATIGDILICPMPGWEVVDDADAGAKPAVVTRLGRLATPAAIVAPGITPKRLDTPVDARAIAPTVARAIWLRAPNGAAIPPVK